MKRRFRTYAEVGDEGGGDIAAQVDAQVQRLRSRLDRVGRVVAIASGKGGVGKSVVTANLAAALAVRGFRVGVVDADLNGPSVAMMLGAVRAPLDVTPDGVTPASTEAGCVVMSMDLLLATPDSPVRWREPSEAGFVWQSTIETGTLREFIADTSWGNLDFLLIDLPPGTDRITRLLALVPQPAPLLVVTTPSRAACAVVARSIVHARDAGIDNIALVSNMDGYVCPHCGAAGPLFNAGAAIALAARTGVPLTASIPFDPVLAESTDAGRPLVIAQPRRAVARAFFDLALSLERQQPPATTTEAAT